MKVKFIFDAQFYSYMEEIVDLQDNLSESDIKAMFPIVLGIEYNDNCSFEAINGKIVCDEEVLAYTE
ncbi:MAG: hypothetical protein K0S18_43 [Anaerocolumna sp.]|jgi:hypothetical protein|nr:hypothetical protein [Anaerocolumna sp.]